MNLPLHILLKALAEPSTPQQPGVALASASGGGGAASPPVRPISLPAVANPPVSAIAGRPPSPVIAVNAPALVHPVPKVNVVANGPTLPSSAVVRPPATAAVVGRPPAPVIAANAPVPARPVPKVTVAATIPALSSPSVVRPPVSAVAGKPPSKALTATKTTVKQTTTKTVAQAPVKVVKQCGADNKVNLWALLRRTPSVVISQLQLLYASVFNTFNSVYPLRDVFTNCGGKCVAMIITAHAKVIEQADAELQDDKICVLRNAACIESVNNKALAAMNIEKPNIVNCFSSVGITFTKDGQDKIVASFVEGIKNAIKNDAQLLDEENMQATIVPATVPTKPKPVQGQGGNVKKPVAIVTPPRVPAQTQPVRLPAPATTKGQIQSVASTIQNSVKPRPGTPATQG